LRIFVAGATGAIGRRLVPMLVEAGHEVTGMTRSEQKTASLREAGADAVVANAFDAEGLAGAIAGAKPEVVIHQLTDIPQAVDPRRFKEQFAGNDRLRVEGTRNLVDAAVAAGVRRVIAQSISFIYAPRGGLVKDEEDPLYLEAPPTYIRTVNAVRELERMVVDRDGIEGVALRYGYFYGPGTSYARDGAIAGAVAKRRFPIVGKGTGCFSFIHVDDAAAATVAAIDSGARGAYNVVDDDPALVREWLPVYADALGAPAPRRAPALLARMMAGRQAIYMMLEQRGASNRKAKRELGWEPRYPSWRKGFREALG
jgi:nucleoside-diphosphate-sugar epimerase